ncbi:hypothetical protein [Actinokineospora cianjurensis]|uniref:hypothetical protein n=1 Tax=Actinokineospora cianjurensis TaxID=585224 RepID=UPI003CCC553D
MYQALRLTESSREPTQQAHTHHALAWAQGQRGTDRKALEHALRALILYRGLDQPVWEARTLNAVGWHAARAGEHDRARAHCQEALTPHRRHHDAGGERPPRTVLATSSRAAATTPTPSPRAAASAGRPRHPSGWGTGNPWRGRSRD